MIFFPSGTAIERLLKVVGIIIFLKISKYFFLFHNAVPFIF